MSNLNKIILVGKLTDNAVMKNTGEGAALAKYTLAVERPKRADGTPGETDFIEITSFGRQAETAGNFTKGKLVVVEGRIQVRSFDDANGSRKWATEVITSQVVALDGQQNTAAAEPAAVTQAEGNAQQPAVEDVPF